jgi:hypothetical protein
MIHLPFNGAGSCSRFAAFHDSARAGTLCLQGAAVCEWEPPVYVNDLDRANYCGGEFLAVARRSPSSSFLALTIYDGNGAVLCGKSKGGETGLGVTAIREISA